jgi:omega-6 fatty acid desaturase (delta-12 desaturase)
MIQHDCGHHSFVPHARMNDLLGRFLGIITLTPYDYWRAAHAHHHAAPGKLGARGYGDIITLTVTEYCALPRWKQYLYRAYRSPVLMFGVGAPLLFLLYYRAPRSGCLPRRQLLANVAFTNLGLGIGCLSLGALIGPKSLAVIYLPTVFLASAFGAWLFFVQHQFESTYWAHDEDWDFLSGAIEGSSYVVLPRILNWFTGEIAIHHVHHLNSRIPNYRLRSFLTAHPEMSRINRLHWRDGVRATNLALWDETNRRLIPIGGA